MELAELLSRIAPLQAEINQLGRQFWVGKEQIAANKFDLSAGRYRDVEQDNSFLEIPSVTLKRLSALEGHADEHIAELVKLIGGL